MSKRRGKTYPVVVIEWQDASSHGQGWMELGDVRDIHAKGVPIISAGIEILRDSEGIVLASAAAGWDNMVGNIFRIPAPFLKKRTVVGKVKVKGEVRCKEPML